MNVSLEEDIKGKVEPEGITNNEQRVDIIVNTEPCSGKSEGEEKYRKKTLVDHDTEGGEPSMISMMDDYNTSMRGMKMSGDDDTNKNKCTFKRGGRCVQHGVIGMKNVISKRAWVKGKYGVFGWKTSKQTTYLCSP